jgi:hypothetical protein
LVPKNPKKKQTQIIHNVPLPEHDWSGLQANDQEHEAAVRRLLRSSSARYAETPELDYATLPPLPHPINKVIQTPASSTVSLASTSLSQRGTYNVTVHNRKRHASTEFPHANRDLDEQQKTPNQARVSLLPVEDSRVLRLRSDPSVASLLDLYDEHGKLSSDAFSNSPPNSPVKEGRVQCPRNGSTLRQLLGAPSLSSRPENDSGSEGGDISWAERFLAERESASSASSLGLRTPDTPRGGHDISFNTDGDLSGNAPENPAISSMEVELSMTTDIAHDLEDLNKNHPYMKSNPSTPQRASQVFGFLTRGKQSKPVEEIERSLPELPSTFSSPSDENVSCDKFESHFSDNSSEFTSTTSRFSSIPTPLSDDTLCVSRARSSLIRHPPFSPDRPASQELRSTFSDDSHDPTDLPHGHTLEAERTFNDVSTFSKQNDVKVIMNGPTKVIVTAPTPSVNHEASSRIPRGPRAFPRRSSSSIKRRRSALVELSNSTSPSIIDPFTAVPPRRRAQTHHRSNSQNSTVSVSRKNWDGTRDYISKPTKLVSTAPQQKENQLSLSVRREMPATPLRSNTTSGSHSLFRSVVHQGMFRPPVGMTPSPASSSEMSPVGRQMMMDVRQLRLKAREADREKSGKRFGNERNALRI